MRHSPATALLHAGRVASRLALRHLAPLTDLRVLCRPVSDRAVAGNIRYNLPQERDPLRPSAKTLPLYYMPTGDPPRGSGTINWPMYPQEYERHNALRTPQRTADVKAASYVVPSRAAEGIGVNNDRIQAYAHWRGPPGQIYSTPIDSKTDCAVTRFERAAPHIWTQANPTYPVEPVAKDRRPMHETAYRDAKFPLGPEARGSNSSSPCAARPSQLSH